MEPDLDGFNHYYSSILDKKISIDDVSSIIKQSEEYKTISKKKEEFDVNFFEKKIYSQFGEDGAINFIFSVIGHTNQFFVEIGVGDGTECNTRNLLENGWKGIMVDTIENNSEFIKKALSPAQVQKVVLNQITASSLVIVPEDQLSLAIGKDGQNVRLAAKLTEWKLDIQHPGSISDDQDFVELRLQSSTLIKDLGFASRTEKLIISEKINTLRELSLKKEELLNVKGFGPKSLEEVNAILKSYLDSSESTALQDKKDSKIEDDNVSSVTKKEIVEEVKEVPAKEVPVETKEDKLEEYSEGVKKRISKLTRKMREAERREKAALD